MFFFWTFSYSLPLSPLVWAGEGEEKKFTCDKNNVICDKILSNESFTYYNLFSWPLSPNNFDNP